MWVMDGITRASRIGYHGLADQVILPRRKRDFRIEVVLKAGKRLLAHGAIFIKFWKVIAPAVVKGALIIVGVEV